MEPTALLEAWHALQEGGASLQHHSQEMVDVRLELALSQVQDTHCLAHLGGKGEMTGGRECEGRGVAVSRERERERERSHTHLFLAVVLELG